MRTWKISQFAPMKQEISYGKDNPNCRIVCAANRKNDLIVCGARHFDGVMRGQIKAMNLGDDAFINWEQGFIDQFGNFYTRKEAWVVAERNNQIVKEVSNPGTLFSEQIY